MHRDYNSGSLNLQMPISLKKRSMGSTYYPKFAKKWGNRMQSLGYYGDEPVDSAPSSDSWIDSALNTAEKLKPAITGTRKLVQKVRGTNAPVAPVPPTTLSPTTIPTYVWYGLGAIVIAGGAYAIFSRR